MLLSCFELQAQTAPKQRGRECWAFRSVLDKKARILTLALNKDMFVAYDAYTGGFYKAWKGNVKFEGPVFNQKHGPQPSSNGQVFVDQKTENTWHLINTTIAGQLELNYRFKGYTLLKDGGIVITTELQPKKDTSVKITIEEYPEFVVQDKTGLPGLQRKIKVKGLPKDWYFFTDWQPQYLPNTTSVETNPKESFRAQSRTESFVPGPSYWALNGTWSLKEGDNEIITWFRP